MVHHYKKHVWLLILPVLLVFSAVLTCYARGKGVPSRPDARQYTYRSASGQSTLRTSGKFMALKRLGAARAAPNSIAGAALAASDPNTGIAVYRVPRGESVTSWRRMSSDLVSVGFEEIECLVSRGGKWAVPTGNIIVQFHENTPVPQTIKFLRDEMAEVVKGSRRHEKRYHVRVPGDRSPLEIAEEWNRSGLVRWAQADCYRETRSKYVPADPEFSGQWSYRNTGQDGSTTNRDVYAEQAWDITRGSSTVAIAILDDGVEWTHPDLTNTMAVNTGEFGGGKETNAVDDDGNGYVDDWRGWDFVHTDNDPFPVFGTDNHGTWSAGIVAAEADNGIGTAGLAHGCRYMPLRVVAGSTGVVDSVWAEAIEYAADMADVITIAYYVDPVPVISDALKYALVNGRGGKGSVICSALGNDGVRRRFSNDIGSLPEVISVSGTSNHDRRSFFSDYGPAVDLMCPAGGGNLSIMTTDRVGALGKPNDYARVNGTSMASPMAAAAAALIISEHPDWTGLEVRQKLEASCDRVDPIAGAYDETGWSHQYGAGRLNAWGALVDPKPAWDTYEPDSTTNTASLIRDGELQYRALADTNDTDWAMLVITNTSDLLLSILGTTNLNMSLHDAGGLVAQHGTSIYTSVSISNLAAGTYFVCVSNPSSAVVSNYGLHYALINEEDIYEQDDTKATAKVISPRQVQYRTFYPENDVDWAKFELPSAATVEIRTAGDARGDTLMWLRDAGGAELAYNDDYDLDDGELFSYITTVLTAGTYYVQVEDLLYQRFSSYELMLDVYEADDNEPDSTISNANTIVSGQKRRGTIFPGDDVDWVQFTLTNYANVLLLTHTFNRYTEADTEITLYGQTTNDWIEYDDNGNGIGPQFSALYQEGLAPGTYHVKIEGKTAFTTTPNYYVSLDVFEKTSEIDGIAAGANSASIAWQGDASFVYDIQYTDNIADTQLWSTAEAAEGRVGANRWSDTNTPAAAAGMSTQRFYRIVIH